MTLYRKTLRVPRRARRVAYVCARPHSCLVLSVLLVPWPWRETVSPHHACREMIYKYMQKSMMNHANI